MNEPIVSFGFRGWDRTGQGLHAALAQLPDNIQRTLVGGVQNAIRELAVEKLKEVTPYRTGRLQRSTIGMLMVEDGRVTLDLEQPAENPSTGQQYVGYLVRGHYTQAGTLVPPNPYPQEALENMRRPVNRLAHEIGRQIAKNTLYAMGEPSL